MLFWTASRAKNSVRQLWMTSYFSPHQRVPYEQIGGYIECLIEEQIKNIT